MSDFPDLSANEIAAIIVRYRLGARTWTQLPSTGIINTIYTIGEDPILRVPKNEPETLVGDEELEARILWNQLGLILRRLRRTVDPHKAAMEMSPTRRIFELLRFGLGSSELARAVRAGVTRADQPSGSPRRS